MAAHTRIFMQKERPETCGRCNLCLKRPLEEVPAGSKFTYYCLLLEKELSGRGVKTLDKQLKFRCKPNQYRKTYCSYDGEFPVSHDNVIRYHIDESRLPL